jgi:hypothetical protein
MSKVLVIFVSYTRLAKGQEISKAIFLETPLSNKLPKFLGRISALASKMGQIKKN